MANNLDLFRQITNALLDLQSSQLQTYERPLKTLGRLLNSEELQATNQLLTQNLDLDAFLAASQPSRGSFAGSGSLAWPENPEQVLGLTLLLITRLANNPNEIINFGFTYYNSGNKVMAGVHSIVQQLLIPFVRDYKDFVVNKGAVRSKLVLPQSDKIFIVHGHDGEARETVARFIEHLGYSPIVLHEQANKGRTIIEKVEANSDVGFAVVLLTPDDEGCVKGGIPEARARQNVLLELGYFIGRLGRDRVCTLKRGELVIPSDFLGVVWESMDTGTWKQSLGRELNAAGYSIDWNKVMR